MISGEMRPKGPSFPFPLSKPVVNMLDLDTEEETEEDEQCISWNATCKR